MIFALTQGVATGQKLVGIDPRPDSRTRAGRLGVLKSRSFRPFYAAIKGDNAQHIETTRLDASLCGMGVGVGSTPDEPLAAVLDCAGMAHGPNLLERQDPGEDLVCGPTNRPVRVDRDALSVGGGTVGDQVADSELWTKKVSRGWHVPLWDQSEIATRSLHQDVADTELAQRAEGFAPTLPPVASGCQPLLRSHVEQADLGCEVGFVDGSQALSRHRARH